MSGFIVKTTIVATVVMLAFIGLASITKKNRTDPVSSSKFEEVNRLINSNKNGTAQGNNPNAIKISETFSKNMAQLREGNFSEGKKPALSLTDGNFITYCYQQDHDIVLLCHVPQLKNFTDDAKQRLAEMAWQSAQNSINANRSAAFDGNVTVGLRGLMFYYKFYVGKADGGPTRIDDDKQGRKALTESLK